MKFGADHGAVRVRRVQGNLGDDSGIEFSAGDLTPAVTTEDERINSSHSSPFQPPLVPDLRPSGSSPILDVNFDEFLHSDGDADDCLQDDWSSVSSSSSDESLLSSFVTWMASLRGRQHYKNPCYEKARRRHTHIGHQAQRECPQRCSLWCGQWKTACPGYSGHSTSCEFVNKAPAPR